MCACVCVILAKSDLHYRVLGCCALLYPAGRNQGGVGTILVSALSGIAQGEYFFCADISYDRSVITITEGALVWQLLCVRVWFCNIDEGQLALEDVGHFCHVASVYINQVCAGTILVFAREGTAQDKCMFIDHEIHAHIHTLLGSEVFSTGPGPENKFHRKNHKNP